MLTFYCFPTCSTCRKAKTWLSEKNVEYQYRDILKDPLNPEEVTLLAKLAGLDARGLINPKSTAFKALKTEADSLTSEEAAELISANPKAMFRPIFTNNDQIVIGFNVEEADSLLK